MEKMEKNKIGKGIILVMLMIFGINFVSALTYSSPSDVYNGFLGMIIRIILFHGGSMLGICFIVVVMF